MSAPLHDVQLRAAKTSHRLLRPFTEACKTIKTSCNGVATAEVQPTWNTSSPYTGARRQIGTEAVQMLHNSEKK